MAGAGASGSHLQLHGFRRSHTLGMELLSGGIWRKSEDPEPGRCRRTDGKKWRCSKEAFPDSKYCEKHMHRGKNRSRKPEEISFATTSNRSSSPSSNQRSFLPTFRSHPRRSSPLIPFSNLLPSSWNFPLIRQRHWPTSLELWIPLC
ncbi:hypothetical protein HPP92_005714 [Vanilla planifolia]|uniref:Growth-regulating factor n=1 Tax=Vanilla planifolia TaxID=51239 RepID=A0A835RP47_VANPL|nr:hypothetical protein HPP92_005714 [Vanilla planifolia]